MKAKLLKKIRKRFTIKKEWHHRVFAIDHKTKTVKEFYNVKDLVVYMAYVFYGGLSGLHREEKMIKRQKLVEYYKATKV